MKRLLYPAIALMNRLSFGMKFSLISIVFFLPMLVTNFYLVRDAYAKFHATQVALHSLDLLGDTLALRGELETLGNLVQINAVLGQSGKAEDVEARILALEQQAVARLSGLAPVIVEEAQVFTARRDELLAGFEAAAAERSLQAKAALYDALLAQAQLLSRLVASQAGLSQDSDSRVRQMSELMTTVTAQVTQTLGEGRAMGAYSLAQGFLNSAASTRFEDLLQKLDKLSGDYAIRVHDAVGGEPQLARQAASSQASLKQASELFERQVVMAETLDAPWPAFYQQVSGLIEQTYQLNSATLALLDQQLQARLAAYRQHMLVLVLALAAVFLLIVYLYGGFYASTRSTLSRLGAMMDKVAGGDMTVTFQPAAAMNWVSWGACSMRRCGASTT
ncbi:hypothetical protein [Pseudomonas brassicae]|uniref:hypothetical protein n=1 Tax=Pseudomonas brassicae TaxID=2708063 RepID=UPI003B75C046